MTAVDEARREYERPKLPGEPNEDLSLIQADLAFWQKQNFGRVTELEMLAGVVEEVGELAHALLKHRQGIRGMEGEGAMVEAAGDAIADAMICLIQLCTLLKLDWGELLFRTAEQVMRRDWKKDSEEGTK